MSVSYCARIENDAVAQVIVCKCSEWASRKHGGEWVCTHGRRVGVGWPVVDGEIIKPERTPPEEDD
jgi:hypothetical protein